MKTRFNNRADENKIERVKNPSVIYLSYAAQSGKFVSISYNAITGEKEKANEGDSIKFLVLDVLSVFEAATLENNVFSFPFRDSKKDLTVWNKTDGTRFTGSYEDAKKWAKENGGRLAFMLIGSYAGKPATLKLNGYALQAFYAFSRNADFFANPVLAIRSTGKQITPNKTFLNKVYELAFSSVTSKDFEDEKKAMDFEMKTDLAVKEFCEIFTPYMDSLFHDNTEPQSRPNLENDDITPTEVDDLPF